MSEEEKKEKKNELLEICEAGDREKLQIYFSEHEPIDIAQEIDNVWRPVKDASMSGKRV